MNRTTPFVLGFVVGCLVVGLLFAWPEATRRATESAQAAAVEQKLTQQEKEATTVVSNFCGARATIDFTPRGDSLALRNWADAELTLCGWYWASPRRFPPWVH